MGATHGRYQNALTRCTPAERADIAAIVEKELFDLDDFSRVLRYVEQYGGIEYTVDAARQRIRRSREHLALFPDSSVKEALIELADYTVSRTR